MKAKYQDPMWSIYIHKFNLNDYARDGPDPTRTYFWPAVNKRPTQLWPRYFLTQPNEILFDPKGKKLKKLTFLGEVFQIHTQTTNGWSDPTRPEQQKFDLLDPGQKFLTQTHHWYLCLKFMKCLFVSLNLNIIFFYVSVKAGTSFY